MEENQDPERQSGAQNGKHSLSTSILNHHGCYMSDGKRKIDFIMAYVLADHHSAAVVENLDTEKRRHYFLDNVLKEGLELESEEVHDSKEVILFIKVHVPFETLCKWAHILKMEMPLKIRDENRRHAIEERGSLYTWWQKTFHFYHCSTIGRENFEVLATDEKVYHPFDDKDLEKFDIGSDRENFFPDRFRQEIAWEALQQARNDPEDEKLRGIEALVEEKLFCLPLVDESFGKSGFTGDREINFYTLQIIEKNDHQNLLLL
uniref:Anoctamin dimerisation domain-containing protein n=1 Tax=Romanomermis culicivorax TaxID=13658 RepID=A0A915IH28_ROMCU